MRRCKPEPNTYQGVGGSISNQPPGWVQNFVDCHTIYMGHTKKWMAKIKPPPTNPWDEEREPSFLLLICLRGMLVFVESLSHCLRSKMEILELQYTRHRWVYGTWARTHTVRQKRKHKTEPNNSHCIAHPKKNVGRVSTGFTNFLGRG